MTQEQQIIQDYLSKTTFIKDICKKYHISSYIFNNILKKYKIEKYDPHFLYPQNQRKFPVNDNFFDIESHEMAYILGLLAADGTVRKNSNEIKLTVTQKDKELLVKLKKLIGGREIKDFIDTKGYESSTWSFTSAHIKTKLAEYYIVPNKTFTLKFPTRLNKKYWIDFIRGYFDGDGSVSTAGQSAIKLQFCSATKEVLIYIQNFLKEEYDLIGSLWTEKRVKPLYILSYSTNATKKIYEIFYQNTFLYLDRKKKKFEEII